MISAYILIGIGLLLGVAEMLLGLGTFYLLFCGLGAIITGLLGFVFSMSWLTQIVLVATLAVVFTFLFRKFFVKTAQDKDEFNNEFLNEVGTGEVRGDMVYFKGTFWHINSTDKARLNDGQSVEILGTKGNEVVIK